LACRASIPFNVAILTGEFSMKCLSLLAVLALAAAPLAIQPAAAQSTAAPSAKPINLRASTARDLAELCSANPKEPGADARINFCHGFAQAAVEVELMNNQEKKPFCFPSPAPRRSTTLKEFVAWVHAVPEHQSLAAAPGLFQFLGERFPCSK
jgi:hypothetical protein